MKKTITVFIVMVSMGIVNIAYSNTAQVNQQPGAVSTAVAASTTSVKINLNTADVATLLSAGVKGIGTKRAQAIVNYRNQHGAFKTLEELAKVKGLGEKFVRVHLDKLIEVFTLA